MKKAVMYGAGNIGRGFIGQLLYESGYHTTFIDVNKSVIDGLNEWGCYPLRLIEPDSQTDLLIGNLDALNADNKAEAARAIASADIMATAVGADVLPRIAPVIAAGLTQRFKLNGLPLDILICENLKSAGPRLRDLICENLPDGVLGWFNENVGLVETSIGRMVPLQTPELTGGDFLRICAEPYALLPADKDAFRGAIPEIQGLRPYAPFSFYIDRKVYIHNMGHALAAYHGGAHGLEYIWQAVGVPGIGASVRSAMLSCADAISKLYGTGTDELYAHIDDLLYRFSSRKLGDTVHRVGRGLRRKLAPDDRLVGALRLCQKMGTCTDELVMGISLALRFSHSDLDMPPQRVLSEICGIQSDEDVYSQILALCGSECG